jgi:hypothetical protein
VTILKNAAKCRKCGDVIESKHRHDFVVCKCWSDDRRTGIFVDGGLVYIRRGAFDLDDIIDCSEHSGEEELSE